MMIISEKKNFIFIHIFKTAGTSITRYLMPYSSIKNKIAYGNWLSRKIFAQFVRIKKDGGKFFTGYSKHSTALQVKMEMGDAYDYYYKFCFVRNPYDRVISAYYYHKQNRWSRFHDLTNKDNILSFLEVYLQTNPLRQVDYVLDDKLYLIVDFIGRYENLSHDIKFIANKLDINNKADVEKLNVSKKRPKNKVLLCKKSIDLIDNYY